MFVPEVTSVAPEEIIGREPIRAPARSFESAERLKESLLALSRRTLASTVPKEVDNTHVDYDSDDDFAEPAVVDGDVSCANELLRSAIEANNEAICEWNEIRLAHETNLTVVRHVLTDELDATHARVSRLLDRLKTSSLSPQAIETAIVELDKTNQSMLQLCAYQTTAIERLGRIDQPLARAVMMSSGRLCV